MGNDAAFRTSATDTVAQPPLIEVSEVVEALDKPTTALEFSGMTEEDRFLLDVRGYLHLPAVLGPAEVAEARAALERVVEGYESGTLPSTAGWGLGLEPSLQRLCTHPDLLPIIDEFTEGAPHLVSTGAIVNRPLTPAQREAGCKPTGSAQLHCQREEDTHLAEFRVRSPGRISCDNFVIFPYLTDVLDGDGGLVVLEGSHKSLLSRPHSLFGNWGQHNDVWLHNGWVFGSQGPGAPGTDGPEWQGVPEGLKNVQPRAGDVIVMPECLIHGTLPWRAVDRPRCILTLRYKSGLAYARHVARWEAGVEGKFEPELVAQLLPPTRRMIEGAEPQRFWAGSKARANL